MAEETEDQPGLEKEQPNDTATTTYHVYHAGLGKHPTSYSFHTIRDSETTILSKPPKPKPASKSRSKSKSISKPQSKGISESTVEENPGDAATPPFVPKILKGQARALKLDRPSHDPRVESTPYYLSLPKLHFASPPYKLSHGGHKRAPVTCLLSPQFFKLRWKLEFGGVLKEEGVIDGRGVVSARFGTERGEGGTFKGFRVRKRRWWGESGREWWEGQKGAGFPEGMDFGALDEESLQEKARPEEVVMLKWKSPFSLKVRAHCFEWRGFEFVWKGTRKVESKKGAKMFNFCNHLKLTVLVPEDSSSISKDVGKREICLARYTCVLGKRKAGRLEVYQDAIDGFLAEYVFNHDSGEDGVAKEEDEERKIDMEKNAKTHTRIRDIIVGTSICMIITERQKRRFLWELLQLIGDIAGG